MKKLADMYDIYTGTHGVFRTLYTVTTFKNLMDKAGIVAADADDYYFNYYSPSKLINERMQRILETVYNFDWDSDHNGGISQNIITQWSNLFKALYGNKYARFLEMIDVDYNPIENYDRYESLLKEYSNSGTASEDGTHSDSYTKGNTGTVTTVDQIEGFNSSSFQDSDKVVRTDALSETNSASGSNGVDREHADEGTEENTNHIHGNIGVTTAEQMLTGYTDFWSRFNLLEIMCRDFDTIITTTTF